MESTLTHCAAILIFPFSFGHTEVVGSVVSTIFVVCLKFRIFIVRNIKLWIVEQEDDCMQRTLITETVQCIQTDTFYCIS